MGRSVLTRSAIASSVAALAVLVAAGAASSASRVPGAVGTPPHVFGPTVAAVKAPGATQQPCIFTQLDDVVCYGPYELGKAYNFPSRLDGRGQTIVIFDAYGNPDIQQDLAHFDAFYGLPDPSFTIINTRGTGATDGSGALSDWASETTLDVEYAHAMAPGARIVLGVAPTDDNNDLNAAEAQVLPRYPGAIVSQSFGQDENAPGSARSNLAAHRIYAGATLMGDSILASTGDFGASDGDTPPVPVAAFPASDPLVLAVGGTEGSPYFTDPFGGGLYVNGGYGAEQVWNETECCDVPVAAGGAPSVIFPRPPWQNGFTSSRGRVVPDVSYNAAIIGGVVTVISCYTPHYPDGCNPDDPFLSLIGGTSAGPPQWAAIIAIADQARGMRGERGLGLVAPALYAVAKDPLRYARDFHDVTLGNNALGSEDGPFDPSQGFAASTGYDDATGLGTPNVSNLVSDLLTVPHFDNPGIGNPLVLEHNRHQDRWHQKHPGTAEPGA